VAYLQGADTLSAQAYAQQEAILYDARILPKDLLTISISATDPESVHPFNLTVPAHTTGLGTYSQPQLQTYLVDNNGQINFPVLGMLDLKGLTKRQAEQKIGGLLTPYLKENPVVTVSFVNYKISVIGEVLRPNTFTVSNEKISVFEALAMAGDMTIYGKRDNVKIIREDAEGRKIIIPMNLNDRNIIFSPYYYLQQNDVIYVEPNTVKAQNAQVGAMTSLWISGASILISVASLVVNILKR
jgi:polysaccharide export outer membrane protein